MLRAACAVVLLLAMYACPSGHGVVLMWLSGGGYSATTVYRVYRQQDGGAAAIVAAVNQNTPTWTDSNVSSRHSYTYWVTAFDDAAQAESVPSNTWSVIIP